MSVCVPIENGAICFSGPQVEIMREPDGVRWCFTCRHRREFLYTVTRDEGLSYYPAVRSIRCGTCDTIDGDIFPGRTREWGD